MRNKLVLVVTGNSQVSTKYAGILSNAGLHAKALCPLEGLHGLLNSLNGALSHAEAVVFTPDAFLKPNRIAPVDAVKALLESKSNLRVLVFRTGGMEGLNNKELLKAGASSVYIGMIPSQNEFCDWIKQNVFNAPTNTVHLEKKRGKTATFSIPRFKGPKGVEDDIQEAIESENSGFLDDSEIPSIGSLADMLGTPIKPKKPNGKDSIRASRLSKQNSSPAKTTRTLPSNQETIDQTLPSVVTGKNIPSVSTSWPFSQPKQEQKQKPQEKVEAPAAISQNIVDLQNRTHELEQVILDLMGLFMKIQKSNPSIVERAQKIYASSVDKSKKKQAVTSLAKTLITPQTSSVVSLTEVGFRRSRISYLGKEFELGHDLAKVLCFIILTKGFVSIHDIVKNFHIEKSNAYVRISNLKKFLKEYPEDLGFCLKNVPEKGYHIEQRPLS